MIEQSQAVRELRECYQYPKIKDEAEAIIAELEAWRKGCEANADALKESCRIGDERRLDNIELRKQLEAVTKEREQFREALIAIRDLLPKECEEQHAILMEDIAKVTLSEKGTK